VEQRSGHGAAGDGGALPKKTTTIQVDVVRGYWEEYGREATRLARLVPSGRTVDLINEALWWVYWIEDLDDRELVWLRASGRRWAELARRYRMSERGVVKRHRRLIFGIVLRLNAS
jgi:hypothetical protein